MPAATAVMYTRHFSFLTSVINVLAWMTTDIARKYPDLLCA